MSDLPEDIDRFFKDNIDNIDVKYNPAHWDKLQQALVAGAGASNHSSAIKKVVSIKKIALIGISSVIIIVGGYYFFSNKKLNEPINNKSIIADSLRIETDTLVPLKTNPDSISVAPAIKDSLKKTQFKKNVGEPLPSFKKDTAKQFVKQDSNTSISKDTVQQKKKKKLGVFW